MQIDPHVGLQAKMANSILASHIKLVRNLANVNISRRSKSIIQGHSYLTSPNCLYKSVLATN